jgi:ABC-type Fe3+/spermidine/putrescine transport system ATPase subunit
MTFVELDSIERINSDVLGDLPRPTTFRQRVTSMDWPNGCDYRTLSELRTQTSLSASISEIESVERADTRFAGLVRSQVYRSLHPRLRRIGVRNQRHAIVAALLPYLIEELALLRYLRADCDVEWEISMHPQHAVRGHLAAKHPAIELPRLALIEGAIDRDAGLTLDNVAVAIGKQRTVGPIDLTIKGGEVIGLLGVNGSGKTTLLRAIGGHLPIRSGRIRVGSRRIDELPSYERGIATVFQDGGLFPDRSAEDNVRAGIAKARRQGIQQRAIDEFARFKAHFPHADFWSQDPGELSGGQRQLTALARAIAVAPKVMLLDEPSASLDHIRKRLLISLIKNYVATQHCAAILISHDLELLMALSDRFLVLSERGEQIADIPARDFIENGCSMTAARILGLPNIFNLQTSPGGTIEFTERAIEVTDTTLLRGTDDWHGAYLPPEALESLDENAAAPPGIELRGWLWDRVSVNAGELLFLRVLVSEGQEDTLVIRTPPDLVRLGTSARVRLVIPSCKVRLMSR